MLAPGHVQTNFHKPSNIHFWGEFIDMALNGDRATASLR